MKKKSLYKRKDNLRNKLLVLKKLLLKRLRRLNNLIVH